MAYMPQSPAGRIIDHIDGSPEEIISRGDDIESLGDQMLTSADVLQDIATRAIEDGTQKGQAIEALRESIGDSYGTLREAGELYQPVGPVIRRYGEGLERIKPQIDFNADRCQELWDAFVALPGEVEPRGTGGLFGPDEGSPEAAQNAEEDEAKKAAHDAWEEQAGSYDFWVDSWENVYDHAVESITDEMSGEIEDGFWRSFLDGLGELLGWAALVVGVLAMIFAGPFAALALAIGLAFLAVTAIQWAMGDKSLLDVGLAVLGVLPLGKLGMLFQRGGRLGFAQQIFKPLGDFGQFGRITSVNNLLGGGRAQWFRVAFQNGNQQGAADLLSRVLVGRGAGQMDDLSRTVNSSVLSDTMGGLFDLGHGVVGNYLKYEGWISKVSGSDSVKQRWPVLDILW